MHLPQSVATHQYGGRMNEIANQHLGEDLSGMNGHTSSESSSATNSPLQCAKPVLRVAATPFVGLLACFT
jgi:hypothetical protein